MAELAGAKDIVAIEADEANLILMEENLRSFPNAMKIKAALAANNDVAHFVRHSSNTGRLVIDNRKESVEVKIVRIGDVLPEHWDLGATYVKRRATRSRVFS
jgi:hypothetical protein